MTEHQPRVADPAGSGLLPSTLAPPPLGFPPLPRPRLFRLLTQGVAATPVTLVAGTAGSGKTVLAATWARTQQGRVAWLSLDAGDDDPAVFRAHLLAALRRTGVDLPTPPAPAPGDAAPDAWPNELAAALGARPERVVLVLDAADSLTAREVTGALDLLVRHAGARLRLVLCARADPLLPLHRYRLDDRLTEIRTADLAFTAEETGALLAALGTPVTPAVAAALQRRTEGWAAALRLASAPLAQGADPDRLLASLAADEGSVAQYLTAEVLDRQPAPVRRFLLRISAAEQLWPDLVDRLAGRPGGHALAALAAANAFVERVPGATGGFRVHGLFRELLQAQLAYEDPGAFAAGHRTCAAWYAAAGDLPAAVEHASAAGDDALAARLLVDDLAVGRLLASDPTAVRLPPAADGPDAAVLRAAAALAGRRPADARDLAAAAVAAGDPGARPALRASAAVVCAAAGPGADRVRTAAVGAERLVAALPEAQASRRAELTAVLASGTATALLHGDAPGGALRDAVGRALALSAAADAPRTRARSLADLALLEALTGRARRATGLAAEHEAVADEGRWPEADRAAATATALAWVHVDRHELAEARRWIGRAARRAPDVGTDALCAVLESRLRRARGEIEAAGRALRPALETPGGPAWVREQVVAEAVRVRLARRDGPAARSLIDQLPPASPRAGVLCSTVAAAGLLPGTDASPADAPADSGGPLPLGLAVEAAVVRACLLTAAGRTATAVAALEQALQLAAPERLRRPFLDAPAQLRPLLRSQPVLAAAGAWLNPTAPAVPTPRHPLDAGSPPAPPTPAAVAGDLSARELEVLGHLAQLLSTEEVAAALFVSVNTVRTHVRSILRKLDVTRRTDAVRRARELHLLEPPQVIPGAARRPGELPQPAP
ncbi:MULTISPECIES: LuxR C-terminal-related transcriptional regulator [unclassified Blastococcus]